MNKMSKKSVLPFTQEQYQEVLNVIKTQNLGIIHSFDREYTKGGVTIVFNKTSSKPTNSKKHNIVSVSTSLCHPNDSYNKKIGLYLAVKNWIDGKQIQLYVNDSSLLEKNVDIDTRINHQY